MTMMIDVSKNPIEIAAQLRAFANLIDPTGAETAAASTTTKAAKKTGKAAKAEEAEEEEQTTASDDGEDFDFGDEAEADETEEDEGPSLEDVIGAFKTFANKTSREKAAKVLAKYKVKSVRDLPEAKYAEVYELITKKKAA